jgi:hypothetical protein
LALLDFCVAVKPEIFMPVNIEELFEDIQNFRHLRKNESTMATCL